MSQQLMLTSQNDAGPRSSATCRTLVTAIHATVRSIAHNGPPLDIMTQLCAVVAHVDLEAAEFFARTGLRSLFNTVQTTSGVQPQAA